MEWNESYNIIPLGIQSPKLRMGAWNLNTFRFGCDYTPLAHHLRFGDWILRDPNLPPKTDHKNPTKFLQTEEMCHWIRWSFTRETWRKWPKIYDFFVGKNLQGISQQNAGNMRNCGIFNIFFYGLEIDKIQRSPPNVVGFSLVEVCDFCRGKKWWFRMREVPAKFPGKIQV